MLKFHGVLTSCRVKRAPHSATIPILGSEAYESVSECSQRPHMDEKWAKSYALQKCYRMWWKMLNNFYVPSISKATFYCCKRANVNSKKKSTKKNSGAPSQVIKEAGSITTYPGELFRIFWDNVYISFFWIPNEKLSPILSKLLFKCPEEQFENKVLVVFFSDCLCNCFGWVVKIALRIRRSFGLWFFFQLWSCFRRFCKTRRKKVFIVTKRLSFRNILRRKRIM